MSLIPSQNRQLLQVALTNVHLFRSPAVPPHVLAAIAEVTGIPAAALLQADWRIARTGSLAPLRELFANPAVPKADGLRYDMELRQVHQGEAASPGERVAQTLTLALASGRGHIEVELSVVLLRRPIPAARERQVARIRVCYKVDSGALHQAFRQEVTIAGDRPRLPRAQRAQAA